MAAIYTSSFLRSLSSSIQTNNRLAPDLWQRLTSLGLSRVKPTRRGLRGGNRRRQVLPRPGTVLESSMGQPLSSYGSFLADFPGEKVNLNGESNLHTAPSSTLNIQVDTLQRVGINNGSIPSQVHQALSVVECCQTGRRNGPLLQISLFFPAYIWMAI